MGDTCFDIGAHTGNHTNVWLQLNARVVALEPQPVFSRLLEKKFGSHRSFTLLRKAAAEEEGCRKMSINRFNPTVSTISEYWKEVISGFNAKREVWNETLDVQTVTLDSLIEKFGVPAFCKIDVEGSEEKVLEGLTVPLPALSFEFFPTTPERTMACIGKLEMLGNYRFNYSITESYTYVSDVWLDSKGIRKAINRYKRLHSGDIYAFII